MSETSVVKVWEEHLWKSIHEAGTEERRLAIERGDIDEDGVPFITVIVDGGWSKRTYGHNYNASSGTMIWRNSRQELEFPKHLPQERGKKAEVAMCFLILLLLICSCVVEIFVNPETSIGHCIVYVVALFSGILSLWVVGQILLRICYCIEEVMHIYSRYDRSCSQLLKDVFSFSSKAYAFGVASVLCVVVLTTLFHGKMFKIDVLSLPMIPVVLAAYCCHHLIKMEDSPHRLMLRLKDVNGLDYGSGMAYSFFYGYLNYMLPDRGDSNMGLKQKIELFCNKEKLTSANFPVKKLFVMIPASGHIAASLTEMDHKNWLHQCKSLEEEIKNVAGVMGRSYKNSLYKIRDPNPNSGNTNVCYVVAEGATPVKTYHNVMMNDPKKGVLFKKYQKEITLRFYTTLVDIIQSDKDCCHLCEIIYYKDFDDNGHPVSVSDVLKERIEEIRNRHVIMTAVDENTSGNMRLLDSQ